MKYVKLFALLNVRLLLFGLNIAALCILSIGANGLAETVTFNNAESLRAVKNTAVDTFSINQRDQRTGRLTNYKEAGMLFLDGVHPPDLELSRVQYIHYHLSYENDVIGGGILRGIVPTIFSDPPGTLDPAQLPRKVDSHLPDQTIQMTYDPNDDGVPDLFNLIRITVLQGALNVGIRDQFGGIAVYNNLTAGPTGTVWTLIDATGLNRATLEGTGQVTFTIDDIVFEPSSRAATAASTDILHGPSGSGKTKERRAIGEELLGPPPVPFTFKYHDFLHHAFVRRVAVDVFPPDCANEIEISGDILAGDTLKVAIVGTADFDVRKIDPNTVLLDGVAPRSFKFVNVPTARMPFALGRCAPERRDKFVDMVLEFDLREILETFGSPAPGNLQPLLLSGSMRDGTSFEGADAVVVPYERQKRRE